MNNKRWFGLFGVVTGIVTLTSCGDGGPMAAADQDEVIRPQIAVTTNILGDVVQELVGDLADVTVIMPVGSDPHSFQASAQEVLAITNADALVTSGAGFEASLVDPINAATAEGVPTFAAISAISTLKSAHDEHDQHDDHNQHDEHGVHGEANGGDNIDPHFFTDPVRMTSAVNGIAQFLSETIPGLDTDAFNANVAAYLIELEGLDVDIARTLETVPSEARILITNHDVFAYFAERYHFEVIGTVIPGGSTSNAASAGDLATLASLIEAQHVPAIFVDTSSPTELAETLISEVDREINVVELFTESLGEAGSDGSSYLDMMRTNARRIADALG